MTIRKIGTVIIMESIIEIGKGKYLISLDADQRKDKTIYCFSYSFVTDGIGDITKEADSNGFALKFEDRKKAMLSMLATMVDTDLEESEYI